MLEFSSLQLALPVLCACAVGDVPMHCAWLCLLCTSLIHHSSRRARPWLGWVDRGMCCVCAALCAARNLPPRSWTSCSNWALGVYIVYVYVVRRAHARSQVVHSSIHTAGALIALNTMLA